MKFRDFSILIICIVGLLPFPATAQTNDQLHRINHEELVQYFQEAVLPKTSLGPKSPPNVVNIWRGDFAAITLPNIAPDEDRAVLERVLKGIRQTGFNVVVSRPGSKYTSIQIVYLSKAHVISPDSEKIIRRKISNFDEVIQSFVISGGECSVSFVISHSIISNAILLVNSDMPDAKKEFCFRNGMLSAAGLTQYFVDADSKDLWKLDPLTRLGVAHLLLDILHSKDLSARMKWREIKPIIEKYDKR